MNLNLFKTNDSDNVINKTLTNKLNITINLKRDVDIISPRLIIRDSASININAFNYCQIEELNRFYFIRSINNMGGNLWEVICECDVLETYKADILNSPCKFNADIQAGDYTSFSGSSNFTQDSESFSNVEIDLTPSIIISTIEVQ